MRSHISVHRATTKYFSNSFVFKNEIEKKTSRDSTVFRRRSEFKSRRPDQNISRVFFYAWKRRSTSNPSVEFRQKALRVRLVS
jgi:hypothetical protein